MPPMIGPVLPAESRRASRRRQCAPWQLALISILLASATPAVTAATATFTDVFPAASPPIPGPNDIYQTNYQGETNSNLGINYYTDNTATPGGTTFVTGATPAGTWLPMCSCSPIPLASATGAAPPARPPRASPTKSVFIRYRVPAPLARWGAMRPWSPTLSRHPAPLPPWATG